MVTQEIDLRVQVDRTNQNLKLVECDVSIDALMYCDKFILQSKN